MSFLRSLIVPPIAAFVHRHIEKGQRNFFHEQEKIFQKHIEIGRQTLFGRDHFLEEVRTYEEFKKAVPLRKYEEYKFYIDKIIAGGENVLWPGRPVYFAKTSGTTSGAKYIPFTTDSLLSKRT